MLITVANLTGGQPQSGCAVNLACELAGIEYPSSDRWQSRYSVVLFDADPGSGIVAHYSLGEHLPVSCEHRRLADSDVERWIQRIMQITAQVDYVVMIDPPHSEAVTKALVGVSDLIVVPCSAAAPDLPAIRGIIALIRAARSTRPDAGPNCLLVPIRSAGAAANGYGIGDALSGLGEPVGPAIDERPEFDNAYRERRWIGDFAWNSPAHEDIKSLALSVKRLLAAPGRVKS
jgi:cellulose biosynthesis protein BcsQ